MNIFPLRSSFLSILRLASSELGTVFSWLLLRSRLVSLVRFFIEVSANPVREQEERFSCLRKGKILNFWFL